MAANLEERIKKSKERTAQLERLRREELREERKAQKSKEQRRNYVVGEMVTKYFSELMNLEPGTKAENAIRFKALETFLSVLSADTQLVQQIKEKAASSAALSTEKICRLPSGSLECVSGHIDQKAKVPVH